MAAAKIVVKARIGFISGPSGMVSSAGMLGLIEENLKTTISLHENQ
jgi:ethanolamine utilization microcompartment shell protein EutS